MKSKILLPILLILAVLSSSSLMAQDEYYRPDSLRRETPERKEVPPVEPQNQKPVLAEKKKLEDFKDRRFVERLRLGGSFGLSLGTLTNVNVSPMAGYELTESLVGGIGVTAMYFKSKWAGVDALYYGGRTFLMYSFIPEFHAIGEVEALNVEVDTYQRYNARKWIASPMLGLGYSQPTGGRFIKAMHLQALYNFNYNKQLDDYGNNINPNGLFLGQPIVIRLTFL